MDIAKYVGLFLLKNEYCFLPGIGSLQVVKKSATYNKEKQQMTAPVFSLLFDPRIGAIDDSFANFIAHNERISIVHASNHLKDFCAAAKTELREGNEVIIPAIGKFVPGENKTIRFEADPDLHIEGKAMPYFKNSASVDKKKEEPITNIIERTTFKEPKGDEEIEYKAPTVNWGKILLLVFISLAVLAGAIFLFRYLTESKGNASDAIQEMVVQEQQPEAFFEDTVTVMQEQAPVPDANTPISYKVGLNQYDSRAKAENRVAKLQSYGNHTAELVVVDSTTYYAVIMMTSAVADTTRIVDSLRKLFNPNGKVAIIR